MADTHRYSRYFTYIQPVIRQPLIKTYGSLILTFVALSAFIIFAIKPTVETIIVLQKKLSDQQKILAAVNLKSQNLTLGRKNYLALDDSIKTSIVNLVPTDPAIGELTKFLETSAKVKEASISAIQFQSFNIMPSSDSAKTLGEIPFNFNVEGSYQGLLSVLSNLRTGERLISIDTLIFNKVEGESRLLLSISGKAYYLK